jgi:hypothetical protein
MRIGLTEKLVGRQTGVLEQKKMAIDTMYSRKGNMLHQFPYG